MAEFSWIAELAGRAPQRPLLVADRVWTVGEVLAETMTLRDRLGGCRILGVLADNSPSWVIAELAAREAGIVHLPLPGFFTADQLRHAIEESGTDALLTDEPERIGALDIGFSITGKWHGLTWMRRVAARVPLPAGTAKITFTSGSTGAPKGVCLSAEGLLDTARAVRERLSDLPLTTHLAVMPLSLLLENVAGVHAPMLRGMTIHLPPQARVGWKGIGGFNPAVLEAAVRSTGANSVILVPELLKAWSLFLATTRQQAPEHLNFVAVGGARVAPQAIEEARRLGIPAYQGYGLTEGGSVLTLNRPGDDGIGVGRPLAHARITVEDGEVVARTRAFVGYTGTKQGKTEAFPTGDLGSFDPGGHLRLHGRRSNLLVTSYGRNISPEWLEAHLLADPRIFQAIVVGDGEPALSAVIVHHPETAADAIDEAISRVNALLPEYARIHRWISSEPFTPANGLATGNGRPARPRILDRHRAALASHRPSETQSHAVY